MSNSKIIYKYRAFNKNTIKLFLNCELWSAKPDSLNDPFDSQYNIDASINSMNSTFGISNEYLAIAKQFQNIFNNFGICSFSQNNNNSLMWSHYANEHYGLCIGFKENELLHENTGQAMFEVTYSEELPDYKMFNKNYNFHDNGIDMNSFDPNKFNNVLTTKDSSWSYEEEKRLVGTQFGTIKFSPKCVASITFGLRMSEDDKSSLIKLLSGNKWNHLEWFQAKKSSTLFTIEFDQIKR